MTIDAAIDNDVLIKLSLYRILDGTSLLFQERAILGTARFVVTKRLATWATETEPPPLEHFRSALRAMSELEPDSDELLLAADLEQRALSAGLEFDSGESLLIAIATVRGIPWLVTGDKRAIFALNHLHETEARIASLRHSVYCLEQVVVRLMATMGDEKVVAAIRQEPQADRALRLCFSAPDHAIEALESYINSLRRDAPLALVAD